VASLTWPPPFATPLFAKWRPRQRPLFPHLVTQFSHKLVQLIFNDDFFLSGSATLLGIFHNFHYHGNILFLGNLFCGHPSSEQHFFGPTSAIEINMEKQGKSALFFEES